MFKIMKLLCLLAACPARKGCGANSTVLAALWFHPLFRVRPSAHSDTRLTPTGRRLSSGLTHPRSCLQLQPALLRLLDGSTCPRLQEALDVSHAMRGCGQGSDFLEPPEACPELGLQINPEGCPFVEAMNCKSSQCWLRCRSKRGLLGLPLLPWHAAFGSGRMKMETIEDVMSLTLTSDVAPRA